MGFRVWCLVFGVWHSVFGARQLVFGVQGARGEAFNQSTKHQTLKTKNRTPAFSKQKALRRAQARVER
jgi:hypothetical protein